MGQNFGRYFLVAFSFAAFSFAPIAFAHAGTASPMCPYSWTRNLQVGSVGNDVLKLQQFLNADPSTHIATSGIGSPGKESTRYGALTKQAVANLQEKYKADILSAAGLTKATGSVGALTRAKLNAFCVSTASSTPISATANDPDTLTISSSQQPEHTLAPAGASGVPFTTITLTAGDKDVIVNSITAQRTGPGADGAFDSISLIDPNGNEIGDDQYFNSNHLVVFDGSFTIPAHASTTLTIMGNMASDLADYVGQTPVIQIDTIDASASIVGSLPLKGTPQTIDNTLVIGGATATLSQYDPDVNTNRYINDTGIRFSGIRITANTQEDLTLSSMTWKQNGTAAAGDLANVETFVNGTSYPTEIEGRSYTSNFSPAIVIKKGQSIDVYVQGDLTISGANRTVEFDIDGSGDASLTGNEYGYGVGMSATGPTATSGNSVFITSDGTSDGDEGTPFFAGSITTINGGTMVSIGSAQ